MTHGSLFSGIGGFDLAAQWMGWENVFHCEIEPFPQSILKYYWPNAISYGDIKQTDFTIHRGQVDVLTGGFPCQPFSMAGKRKGTQDARHLWPEYARAIREIQPRWVVGENVSGLLNWNGGLVLDEVYADLEVEGYEVWTIVLPACAIGAPHRRDRVWVIAHSQRIRLEYTTQAGNIRGRKEASCGEGGKSSESAETNGGKRPAPDTRLLGQEERQEPTMGADKLCQQRPAPDTDKDGQHGCDCEHEEQPGQGGFDALNDPEQATAPDTEGLRDRGGLRQVEGTNDSYRESKKHRENNLQPWYNGEIRITPDTEGTGGNRKAWANFPTQSPVCGRNDGLPTELDGITFPKWRNESIKGYGNAIVPQLAYEIFKFIEQTELV